MLLAKKYRRYNGITFLEDNLLYYIVNRMINVNNKIYIAYQMYAICLSEKVC